MEDIDTTRHELTIRTQQIPPLITTSRTSNLFRTNIWL
jgi:hypothetical protein